MTEETQLPFNTEAFKTAWNEWLAYRKERRLPKYVPRGLKATFSKLVNDSGNIEETAIKMIINSIACNWQGIFKIKDNENGFIGSGSQRPSKDTALRKW